MAENAALYATWESYKCENIEEVMDKAGASFLAKKVSGNTNPTVTITKVDDKVIHISSKTLAFTVDQEVEIGGVRKFKPPQGDEQECTAEWQDSKLVIYAGKPGTADLRAKGCIKQTREVLENGELRLTMQVDDTIGHRWFKKT